MEACFGAPGLIMGGGEGRMEIYGVEPGEKGSEEGSYGICELLHWLVFWTSSRVERVIEGRTSVKSLQSLNLGSHQSRRWSGAPVFWARSWDYSAGGLQSGHLSLCNPFTLDHHYEIGVAALP